MSLLSLSSLFRSRCPMPDANLHRKGSWQHILVALLGAIVVSAAGYAALILNVHDPTPFKILIESIGLPFVRLGERAGLLQTGLGIAAAASLLLWCGVLYLILSRALPRRESR